MPAATDSLPIDAFRDSLRAAIGPVSVGESRLCRLLADPRSPSRLLKAFAANIHTGAKQFPGLLAALIASAPDPVARSVLMDNLLEEHGVRVTPGRGLVAMPGQCHADWSALFVRACGGDPDDIDEHSDATLGGSTIDAMLNSDRWLEAVAFLLIGQEATFGKACPELVTVLRRRGFSAEDIVFFSRHAIADQRHAEDALALVSARAESVERQMAVIAAAAAGARHWRSQYELA